MYLFVDHDLQIVLFPKEKQLLQRLKSIIVD